MALDDGTMQSFDGDPARMNRARPAAITAAILMQSIASGPLAQTRRARCARRRRVRDRIIPLEATVNGTKAGAWPFVERAGALYVVPEAIEEWRLQLPANHAHPRAGRDSTSLAAMPGFTPR